MHFMHVIPQSLASINILTRVGVGVVTRLCACVLRPICSLTETLLCVEAGLAALVQIRFGDILPPSTACRHGCPPFWEEVAFPNQSGLIA